MSNIFSRVPLVLLGLTLSSLASNPVCGFHVNVNYQTRTTATHHSALLLRTKSHQHGYAYDSSSFPTSVISIGGRRSRYSHKGTRLTTSSNDEEGTKQTSRRQRYIVQPISKAVHKFKSRPATYLIIPLIAALVGWFTNWLAVQMIFYPIQYRGLNLYRVDEVPLGFLGWQGIVPCKTRTMSDAMVHMVTSQLLEVKKVFARLDPDKVAGLLAPEVPILAQSIVEDISPKRWMAGIPKSIVTGLPPSTIDILQKMNHNFLKDFTIAMQDNIDHLFHVRNCVVDQMMKDRTKLGTLFQKCGSKELDFLTNSGLWFGFLLGLIQMVVALFWDNPWSLSIGGGIVGLATNWLALKWIFEPVNPTKVGPFILQGQFLRRQKEVAKEFSSFFANNVLTSEKMFESILSDPLTAPKFNELFQKHLLKFAAAITSGLHLLVEPEVLTNAAQRAIQKLPQHIHVLHPYVDSTLQLQETLRVSMENMSSAQFERVLHPIFEEDELTLILAGAALGFGAGLIQQGLETGKLTLPTMGKVWGGMKKSIQNVRCFSMKVGKGMIVCVKSNMAIVWNRIQRKMKAKDDEDGGGGGRKDDGDVVSSTTS